MSYTVTAYLIRESQEGGEGSTGRLTDPTHRQRLQPRPRSRDPARMQDESSRACELSRKSTKECFSKCDTLLISSMSRCSAKTPSNSNLRTVRQ
eukprot:4892085-Amphidinium_carterae.1